MKFLWKIRPKNIEMNKIFYFILLTFLFFGCNKEEKPIDYNLIELAPYIIDNYTTDAKQLYMHETINDSTHLNFNNSVLDTNEIVKILKIIQAVYNSDSPERDTVFDKYQIHGYYCYSFNSMSLEVQTDQAGIINLSNGIIPTGDLDLDALLTTYHFDSVKTYYSYPDFPWLTIYTKDEYNLIPVENEFENIEAVFIAEFNKACMGDGNTITLIRDNSSATITFSIGSGDCPSGCIYHSYWKFKVTNGIAQFIQAYED